MRGRGGDRVSRTILTALALVITAGCATKKPGTDRTLTVAIHPVHPITGSTVMSRRPRVRWAAAEGVHGYTVRFCRDRRCDSVLTTVDTTDTVVSPSEGLPQGLVFWRVEEAGGARVSPVWYFIVGAGVGMAPADRASQSRVRIDADGDGRGDVITGLGDVRPWQPGGPVGEPWATLQRPDRVCTSAGDMDGNGFPDVACTDPSVAGSRGELSVYLGPLASGLMLASRVVLGPDGASGGFGEEGSYAGAVAGDFNADGFTDLAISAPNVEDHRGRIHVFAGGLQGIGDTLTQTLESPFGAGGVFHALAAGDVDGDGADDLLVSAVGPGVPQTVYVALHRGIPGGLDTAPAWVGHDLGLPQEAESYLAGALADVTGDGLLDAVIGRPTTPDQRGCVFVFPGTGNGFVTSPTQQFCGPDETYAQFGAYLDAGDLDGDGVADLACMVFSPFVPASRRCLLYRGGAVITPMVPGELRGPGGDCR